MKDQIIAEIERAMLLHLDNAQMELLHTALITVLGNLSITSVKIEEQKKLTPDNSNLISIFLSAKKVEGCSEKTIKYYNACLTKLFSLIHKHAFHITTEDLRNYLSDYEIKSSCSKINIDNIRRILSSFFAWLENECYILKSPVRRIHKIRTNKPVKETFSDESLEKMRDNCENIRDQAIIDLLASTGMRVGELVGLNRVDIDFENRECVVLGKGNKERPVYFDARTKLHLKNYLDSRTDENPALFVSLQQPYKRLEISGVEIRLRKLGKKLNLTKVHPHKFRRTLATRAIDKGMPIEQVQRLLGHSQIDTTMQYAMVDQQNVKQAHKRFIS